MATGRRTLVGAGLLTEECVSFPVLSALAEDYRVRVVADACGGLTQDGHWAALQRMQQAGAVLTSWLQILLEFQRDWTRRETYETARDRGRAHRWLRHRVGLRPRDDQAGLTLLEK